MSNINKSCELRLECQNMNEIAFRIFGLHTKIVKLKKYQIN